MTLYIEARLRKSGATLLADYDLYKRRMIVTDIRDSPKLLWEILEFAVANNIQSKALEAYAEMGFANRFLPIEKQDAELKEAIPATAAALFPLIHIFANNLSGLRSGHGMSLGFSPSFSDPPFWKDTVKNLTVGVAPYRA